MEKTWRWFGKGDVITLEALRQIGVEGIVTALHHIPNGEVWSESEISAHKNYIENAGLRWSVVESLPVSESIKYGGKDRDALIDNYIVSLENLGKCGIHTVCYNFMPVIDWIRTELMHKNENGTYTLYFDKIRFAYFDIHILERKGAQGDYSESELAAVAELAKVITQEECDQLVYTIIVKTQGFVNGNIKEGEKNPVNLFNALLKKYEGINKNTLRENLKYFLERVTPMATQWGINLCIHPDDPPFAVLGLPRIVTCEEDIDWLLKAVDTHSNGLTFCAGSLSAGAHNNVAELAAKFASRTHFIHLRSTDVLERGDFIEASHLAGRGELVKVVEVFIAEQARRTSKNMPDNTLPMRVDHGVLMLDDMDKQGYNPGYSFLGRMQALAQVSGVMETINYLNNEKNV